jgi:hypothetical protein
MNKRADISQTVIIASMFVLASVAPILSATPKLNIKLKNGSEVEQRKKDQIERLAQQYDLKKYTKTRDIEIEERAINHSMPVLTLNTGFMNDDDLALSAYVHEQAHWIFRDRLPLANRQLETDLERMFPALPYEWPQGDGQRLTSYYHLAVCALEWDAMDELVGTERARKVIDWKKSDHYTAIYAAVVEHRDELEKIMKRHGVKF